MAIIIYNFNLGPENRRCRFPRFLSGLATLRSLANFLGAAVSTVIYSHACLQWPGRLFVAPPLFNSIPSPQLRPFVLFIPPAQLPGQTCAKSFRFWPPTATRTFMFCCRPMLFFLFMFLFLVLGLCWYLFGSCSPERPQLHKSIMRCSVSRILFTLSKISRRSWGSCSQIFRYLILCG